MDNEIFQNATMFDPTRFDKNAPSPPPFSYVAFGAGPRMCPGVELAKMETLAMIHRLVTQFTWELVKKDESFKRIPMPEFDHGFKSTGEALTWEDLTKMKYTWKVASEIMRIYPPVALSFRRSKQDIEYGGFIIPKGWQVLLSPSMTHMDNEIFQNATIELMVVGKLSARLEEKKNQQGFCCVYDRLEKDDRMKRGRASEIMRIYPPVALSFRRAKQDIEYGGFIIPKGWQFTWELVKKDESFKRIPMPEFDHGLLVRIKPI
nr:cytochrome P450 716B1-like [Tanacetum cinerariifolium]